MISEEERVDLLKEISDRNKNIILVKGKVETAKSDVIIPYLEKMQSSTNIISLDSEKDDFFKKLDDILGIEKEPEYVYEKSNLDEIIASFNGKENVMIMTPDLSFKTSGIDIRYITTLDDKIPNAYNPSRILFEPSRDISRKINEGGAVIVDDPEYVIAENNLAAHRFIKYAAEIKRQAGDNFQFVADTEALGSFADGYKNVITPVKRKNVSGINNDNVIVVEEDAPKKSIDIYREISKGKNTLVISPETKEWLNENDIITGSHVRLREGADVAPGEYKVIDIGHLAAREIYDALNKENSVIYITGVNAIYNSVQKASSIIKRFTQKAQKNNNTIIISVDPTGLTTQQIKMLERDAVVVKKNEKFGKIDKFTSELNEEKRLRALEEMSKKGSTILNVDNIDHADSKYVEFLLKAANTGIRVLANYDRGNAAIDKISGLDNVKTVDLYPLGVPADFDDDVKSKIEEYFMNDDEKKVLEYASVLGMKFDVDMMIKLVGDDGEKDRMKMLKTKKNILSAVNSLETAGLIKKIGDKEFEVDTHVKRVEYESLDADIRAIMHEEIAWELDKDKSNDAIDVLVQHFNEAEKTIPVLDKLIGYASTLSDMSEDISVSDKYLDIALNSLERKQELVKVDYKELTGREFRVKTSLAKKKQDILLISGKEQEVVEYAEKSVREFTPLVIAEKIDRGVIADFNFRLGKAKTSLGFYDEALVSYQNAAAIYEAAGNNTGLAETYAGMGMTLLQAGKNDDAKRIINCAIESARKNRTAATRAVETDIHIAECASALKSGNIEEALSKANVAVYDAKNIDGNDGVNRQIYAHIILADVYKTKSDLGNALINYQKAAELAEGHGYVRFSARAHEEAGLMHGIFGNYQKAIEELNGSLKSYKRCGDEKSIKRIESLLKSNNER